MKYAVGLAISKPWFICEQSLKNKINEQENIQKPEDEQFRAQPPLSNLENN